MAEISRVNGKAFAAGFYGLKGALVTVSYSGKFTADSVDGTTKVITEGGYSKAVKALEKKIAITAEEWDKKKDEIMAKAVRAKFTQYPELRSKLLETGEKQIGNADAREMYWGIGTSMDTDKARVPSKWRGQNKLGKILMELRKTLVCESG
jgi:ribA/ribD-fused uncharacterized protein